MSIQHILKAAIFTPTTRGWGLPIAAEGAPGEGKSAIIEQLGARWRLPTYVLDGAKGEGAYGVIPVPTQRADGSYRLTYPAPEWSDVMVDGGLIFVDELSTNDERVQRAMLGLLLDKRVGNHMFGQRVRIVAALNPPELAAGGVELAPPVCNRMVWLPWAAPTVQEHLAYMMGAMGDSESALDAEAEEERVSAAWSEVFARSVGLEAAFFASNPTWKNRPPRAGEAQNGRAWPSDRSWEMMVRAHASSAVHGLSDSDRDAFCAGAIGNAAYEQFAAFAEAADMPNVPDVLDGRESFRHSPKRLDRTAAVLASATAIVLDKTCVNRAERTERLWQLLGDVGSACADIVVPSAEGLTKAGLHVSKAAFPVLAKIQPVLKAARG